MMAFREPGKSITGGTYASLPHGPQLNNYRELVDSIRKADEKTVEPLTKEEKRIICKLLKTFPTKEEVFNATQREEVCTEKADGSLMPYSDAEKLTQR